MRASAPGATAAARRPRRDCGLASTIVDCTREEPVILRLGALSEEQVMAVVQRSRAHALELSGAETDAPPPTEQPESTDE